MAIDLGMLVYQGQPMFIENISRWDRRTVYTDDGAHKELTHHHIGVTAVWNPQATRSALGKPALVSIAELSELLLTPRGKLTITIGGEVVLQSPAPKAGGGSYPCDAKNGPNPIALNVTEIMGIKTCIAYFEIETWIANPCQDNPTSILSHRWSMTHEYDDLLYCTRRIHGEAVFRTDYLNDRGQLPDDFRRNFFHPLPTRMKREGMVVTASEDGASLTYDFVDVQQPVILLPIIKEDQYSISKVRGKWRTGWKRTHLLGGWSRWVSMNVEAWGSPGTSRAWPIICCLKMVAAFGFNDLLPNTSAFYDMDLEVDLWDKYASLSCGLFLAGVGENLAADLGALIGAGRDPLSVVNALGGSVGPIQLGPTRFPEVIDGVTSVDNTKRNPVLPQSGGTRGTFVEALVTQALLKPCVTPPAPPLAQGRSEVKLA